MSESSEPEEYHHERPSKPRRYIKSPDFKARDAKVTEIRSSIKQIDEELAKINKDIEVTVTPKPVQEKRKALTSELGGVIRVQSELKKKRALINDQIKAVNLSLKKKIATIQTKTSKHSFKSGEDIDKKIKSLEDLIDTGTLKIVDERRNIKEISSLRRIRKDFSSIQDEQKLIDEDKAKIAELRKSLGDANNKEAQEEFEKVTKELDDLSVETKGIQKKRDELFSSRRELYKKKDGLYDELRSVKQDYDNQFKKFKQELENEKKKREEEEKEFKLNARKEELEAQIVKIQDSAKQPANSKEITTVESLLIHFDPSYVKTLSNSEVNSTDDKLNSHHKQSKVEMPANAVLFKKEPENFFVGTKSKKGKKHNNNKKKSTKFVLEPVLISELSSLGIPLPASQEDSDKTVELLKAKLNEFKEGQDDKTKANIAAGEDKVKELQKQIEGLDKEIEAEQEAEKKRKEQKAEEKVEVKEEEEAEEKAEEEKEDKKPADDDSTQ
ncbi:DEKNAAC102948 [Brettanomyces naardenensis]|uniref:DEKNAAC102948 n=1 Tax=Brettanomyces naardenensis TaxID=13370 RepID=A0A448YM48_BRENA|nr:DEKNAAC102948 [Brettanomyces naardenensis]